jgi:hypothetical protein
VFWDDAAVETNLGDGRICVSWVGVAGRAGIVPHLVLQGRLRASGYGPGATVQIEVDASITWETPGGHSFLGVFGPAVKLVRWPAGYRQVDSPPVDEMCVPIELLLPLPAASVESMERARNGTGFSLLLNSTVILLDGGLPAAPRTDAYYGALSARTGQDMLPVTATDWVAVLERWGAGAAVTVLVPLDMADPVPARAEIVAHLQLAREKIGRGDYTGSIAEARQALELLRGFRTVIGPLPRVPKDRDPLERIYAMVDALYSFASASGHPDPPVKDFAPERPDAIAVVAGAASVTQQLFHWLDR